MEPKRLFKRKIYDRLLKWKQESNGNSALLIEGARRIGKSTIVQTFARLIDLENEHLKIYFAHPYSSYERGTNERHNRMIRIFIPKGTDISQYSEMDIEDVEDWMNNLPRKNLGYHTPEQMFESELDMIYKRTS